MFGGLGDTGILTILQKGERKEGNLIIISLSSSSSSMAEVTMICVDNSGFMCGMYGGLGLMKAQTDAIELYFSAKLEAHPDNLVGFTTMGALGLYCKPSRDPKYFWSTFKRLEFAGSLQLPNCLLWANFGLYSNPLPNKRLVMFAGGGRKDMLLQAFVALVDNGRYLYAPTGSHDPLTKNLSSSPIMPTAAAASFKEDDIQPLGMNKVVIPHKNKMKHRNKNKPVV
ncbi:26S proteasome non-ATPase regulatory subunit 4 [Tanacetum coccineum]|uniref:26S proteasome non-ATPase regulatory subunit 4 n=1 Tax=Tanacetum coccineum TaxID=301880 RepID=A0ABQ5HZV9_9ASTR